MATHHKLSLFTAVLVNINIMFGAGVFINTTILAQRAGALGALSYALLGIIMLPLILSIARIVNIHPTGNFYIYGQKELNPFAGFFSAWSYIVGKLASATIMTHVFSLFLRVLVPPLAQTNVYLLDLSFFVMFVLLNLLHVKTGGTMQTIFAGLKIFPIVFLVLTGLYIFNGSNFNTATYLWEDIPSTLPLVLFSILGFEAACSLSSKIENPEKNASRAILISYAIAITTYCIYQLVVYGALAPDLAHYFDYRSIFPGLMSKLLPNYPTQAQILVNIFHIAIASSALSGSYGIFFSNSWNLYALAQHNHLFFSSWFTQLNTHHIPWLCVLAEGIICSIHLFVTHASQIPLQLTGALGCAIGYTMSVTALIAAKKHRPQISTGWFVPLLGFGSCMLLLTSCIQTLYIAGLSVLLSFASLLSFGAIMFMSTPGNTSNELLK